MNPIKKINFLVLTWAIEALNQDVETKRALQQKQIDFAVGGQAVIEGVMMRSPNNIAIAVRKPSGKIVVKKKPYKTLTQRYEKLNVPIVRGIINLFEMMIVGTHAINFSANEAIDEEPSRDEETRSDRPAPTGASESVGEAQSKKNKKPTKLMKLAEFLMFSLSFVVAMALSLFLFKFIPLWITTFLEGESTYIEQNYIVFNLIDGVLKMSIFLSYIFILSLIPTFRRIFEYHGAEHKSIFNYESRKPLTVENAKDQSRFHPRCGTSFILIVFVISILVYTFVPKQPTFWSNLGLRVAVLPFIAGISYEYLKLSAKHADNIIVKALIAPGLWFQRLTTKDPDKKQLAVGLKSLRDTLAMEKITTKQ